MSKLQDVSGKVDFPKLERDILKQWQDEDVVEKYLHHNDDSETRYSFFDGPITANNPMGVHHSWGRTYKDLFQRYHAMLGKKQRFQNGFDCQGLWVEVEVEKELGLKSKRDIESYGIAEFVNRCKERVWKYADRITDQSIRMGYWMDWDNSYFTMSDENNYTIWHFLKSCHERGWIYKGHDVMPWCPRCGTGISEHEIVTEGYQERTHLSVYVRLPIKGRDDESLLVWTTTPWTLTSNVAAAVHPDLTYLRVAQDGHVMYVAKEAVESAIRGEHEILDEVPGSELVGLSYSGPFDHLPANGDVSHRVIPWTDVSANEGTGIVHIAPGCGKEDFGLSREHGLDVVAPIDQDGIFVENFDWLEGQYVHDVAKPIADDLRNRGILYRDQQYTHRYPVCWRCSTDLAFRLVDEWFISMEPLREPMKDVTRQVNWVPAFGKERELDWLSNMDDWMISKKRYWGLALPIYECDSCEAFEVIGSETELQERAVDGWDRFEGHTPHRPWIDEVKIACPGCAQPISRITDVGNPWLDAGIVGFSTIGYRHDREYWEEWYPADLITESFPGQFRNWFYSMIAQSTALTDEPAFRNVFSYALMRDEQGKEMHKSAGNAIWFDDAAEISGVDVMRWLYSTVNPSQNLNFGYDTLDQVRRQFILPLWNSYAFFVTYARLDGFDPSDSSRNIPLAERPTLDRWIISRLHQVIAEVRSAVEAYHPEVAGNTLERFIVDELSNWYIRRNRRRFWKSEADADKRAAYETLYEVLTTATQLLAPFVPFLSEALYQNLVRSFDSGAPISVHLTRYPESDVTAIDEGLSRDMAVVLEVVNLGRAARSEANVKVRQPLPGVLLHGRDSEFFKSAKRMEDQILDELNVKALLPLSELGEVVTYDIRPNLQLLGPKHGRLVPHIRAALDGISVDVVALRVASGEAVELSLTDGELISLAPEEILVDLRKREGYAAAQGKNSTIVLDTTLTPELVKEGIARDIVRGIQDARKNAGFDIEDRISASLVVSEDVGDAIDRHYDYIVGEVLADRLTHSNIGPDSEDDVHRDTINAGSNEVPVLLKRT